jgi:protein FAM32A
MSFTGGKLKLKGGVDGSLLLKKKKKKKKEPSTSVPEVLTEDDPKTRSDAMDNVSKTKDTRTEAEKRRDAHMMKYERERAKKAASKSHRQRIEELNSKLANLTEHHDLPKISYSYM